jgi:two-component sensor histidine kinase
MAAKTLRTKLLWIVFAALLPLTGVAVWQGDQALKDSRELVSARLRANAWGIAESQRDPFIIAEHSLAFAAESPDVREMRAGCGAMLANAMQGAAGILNFVRTDANGKAQCSVLPFTKGDDLSHDPWWLKRGDRKEIYLAAPEIGRISKRPVHIMVLPIFDQDEKFQGTLSAGISIEQLKASLHIKQLQLPGTVFVADSDGRPVIATEQNIINRFSGLLAAQHRPQLVVEEDGREWIYVSAPLYRNKLFIVYAEPERLVMRAALSRIWPNLLFPLLALLLTSIAIWIATQRLILRWLSKLQTMTARFANGDFRSEISDYADAPTELAEFAADLHHMAAEIVANETELRSALAAKTALTKEVNHRVKNNLQIVNSLLSLQLERISEPAAKRALGLAKSRIGALGLLHRLLYESEDGVGVWRVDIQRLMTELYSQLRNVYREQPEITLTITSAEISLSAAKAVPLILFTVEAVTNAFQHAFVAGHRGSIRADVSAQGSDVFLTVADDGCGFVQSSVVQNMGYSLMEAFAKQVDGTVKIDSSPSGTVVILSFKREVH